MYFQDGLTAIDIGIADRHLAVKATGAQQRRIQNIRAVGGSDDDNALIRTKAVHLHKQLVERLLALIVAAAHAGAAVAADGIDLINEDDGRRILFGLGEQVAHAGGAYTDVHFHEVRTGDGKERDIRLARYGAGQQRFTGAGRADEQDALRDARAQIIELERVLEEFDDLAELLLFLIRTGDVVKGGLALLILGLLNARLAKGEGAVGLIRHGLAHFTRHIQNHQQQHAHQNQRGDHGDPPGVPRAGDVLRLDRCIRVLAVILHHVLMDILNKEAHVRHGVLQRFLARIHRLILQRTAAHVQGVLRDLVLIKQADDLVILRLLLSGLLVE